MSLSTWKALRNKKLSMYCQMYFHAALHENDAVNYNIVIVNHAVAYYPTISHFRKMCFLFITDL